MKPYEQYTLLQGMRIRYNDMRIWKHNDVELGLIDLIDYILCNQNLTDIELASVKDYCEQIDAALYDNREETE